MRNQEEWSFSKRKKRTGGSARAIVSYGVLLKWYICLCSDPTKREDGLRGTGVTLFRVRFNSDSLVHQWFVVVFMLLDERRVDRVSYITREEEGASECSLISLGFSFALNFEGNRDSLDARLNEVGFGSIRRN